MDDDFSLWEDELNDEILSDNFLQTMADLMEDQLAQIDQDEVVSILAESELYEAAARARMGLRFLTMSEFGGVLMAMQKIPIFMFCSPDDKNSVDILSMAVNVGRNARTLRRVKGGVRSVEVEEGA